MVPGGSIIWATLRMNSEKICLSSATRAPPRDQVKQSTKIRSRASNSYFACASGPSPWRAESNRRASC